MTQPLISVIVPNYNYAQYLDQRMESILSQTYQNYEVIILDDKSTDNSLEVIEKYRSHPKVVKVIISEVNSGSPFKQWEKGIREAKGDIIWIAESDDYCAPTLLERLVLEFEKHSDLVLSFSTSRIMDETGVLGDLIQSYKIRKDIVSEGLDFVKRYLYWDNVIYNASSALFKKDVALNINGDYTTFKASGDWLFWICICRRGRISMVNEGLNYFRKHTINITEKAKCNGIQQIENKRVLDYLISKKMIGWWEILKLRNFNCYRFSYFINFDDEDTKHRVLDAWHFSSWYYIIAYVRHLLHNFMNA